METAPKKYHSRSQSATATTANGAAVFQRSDRARAELRIAYRAPGLTVLLQGNAVEAGVVAACEDEVRAMRASLSALGEAIAAQLSTDGLDPVVKRRWRNAEVRVWKADEQAFQVQPSRWRAEERLTGYEGTADALLVRETIRLMIEQREANIRDIYRTILADARATRPQTRG